MTLRKPDSLIIELLSAWLEQRGYQHVCEITRSRMCHHFVNVYDVIVIYCPNDIRHTIVYHKNLNEITYRRSCGLKIVATTLKLSDPEMWTSLEESIPTYDPSN